MNNIIGTQIANLRSTRGMTQEELANKLGYSKQTISNWETGLKTPRMGAIQKVADLFNVNKSFIIEGSTSSSLENIYNKLESSRQQKVYRYAEQQLDEQKRNTSDNKVIAFMPTKTTTVELSGRLSAGGGAFNDKGCIESVEVGSAPSQYDLAFQVCGDSMYPTFQDGEIVFVKETMDIYNGQIGAIEINGEAFIKKMYLEGTRLRLVSLNTELDEDGNRLYPDFYADELDDLYVIGRVII
ncbi:XRE family transcriptional regulator [Enterococcus faecalis]